MTRSASTIILAATANGTTFLRTAEFGEYPQSYVGAERNAELLTAEATGELIPTGHTYSTYADKELLTLTEYTFDGKKYAKLDKAVVNTDRQMFTNEEVIVPGNPYYFNVELLVWDCILWGNEIVAVCKNLPNSCALQRDDDANYLTYADCDLRDYLAEYFLSDTGLQPYCKEYSFYPSAESDATYGTLCTDKIWVPSMREIETFYPIKENRLKYATDFAAATFTGYLSEIAVTSTPLAYHLRDISDISCETTTNNMKVNNHGDFYSGNARTTNNPFGVAFVLSDTAIAEVFTPGENIERTYDQTDHRIENQATKPAWDNENMQITYTQGGKNVTTIVDVGQYVAQIQLGDFTSNFMLTVNPRPITYVGDLSVKEKSYDGTVFATVDTSQVTFDNVLPDDADGLRLSINADFQDKNAGDHKRVTATVSLAGDNCTNYTLTNGGTKILSGKINRCTAVVRDIKVQSKEYDGTKDAIPDLQIGHYSLSGKIPTDDLTVSAICTFDQVASGNNIRVDVVINLEGADANNYLLGAGTQTFTHADITPRAITVTINKVRSPMNTEPVTPTATITSGTLVTGDTLSDLLAFTIDADYAVPGNYPIKVTGTNKNYLVTFANEGIYEVYDPALEPDAVFGTVDTKSNNIWLVLLCAGGVTLLVLIIVILIAVIKHQHRLAKQVRQVTATATTKEQ